MHKMLFHLSLKVSVLITEFNRGTARVSVEPMHLYHNQQWMLLMITNVAMLDHYANK